MSPTNSGEQTWGDRQFVVIASEKVARVVALPSQNCVYKQIITEVSFVVKAEIIQIKGQWSRMFFFFLAWYWERCSYKGRGEDR